MSIRSTYTVTVEADSAEEADWAENRLRTCCPGEQDFSSITRDGTTITAVYLAAYEQEME